MIAENGLKLSKKILSFFPFSFRKSVFIIHNKRSLNSSSSAAAQLDAHNSRLVPRVVFFGTDLLSIQVLSGLVELCNRNLIKEIQVVTNAKLHNPPKQNTPKTDEPLVDLNHFRGNQIIEFCARNKISYHVWSAVKKEKNFDSLFAGFHVGVVASFGHLIPSSLIQVFPYGILNVHPSLLPRWRGASPIVYSVLFGDAQVGVSVMKIMPKHFDVGPIISQRATETPPRITSLKLLHFLANIGVEMLNDVFANFEVNANLCQPQLSQHVTYAHKITSEMFYVDWSDQTWQEIDNQYRALHEINHLKTKLNGQVVKLMEMLEPGQIDFNSRITNAESLESGRIVFLKAENLLAIKCKNGLVGFRKILLKKKLSGQDFYNGYMNNKGPIAFQSVPNQFKENILKPKLN